MSRYRILLAVTLAAGFLLAKRLLRWAPIHREHLIKQYYRSLEPDWRRNPPKNAATLDPSLEMSMPSWYGNLSEVRSSPYDFVPRPLRSQEKPIRVLFLLDFPDYLIRTNSHSYEM